MADSSSGIISYKGTLNIDKVRQEATAIKNWAEDAVKNGYDSLGKLIKEVGGSIDKGIFDGFSAIFFNSIAYNLIGIIVVLWLFYHMRSGFSREDIFKGGIWLITLCFIYGILSNYGAYTEFKSWFDIPSHILQSVVSSLAGGKTASEILASTFKYPIDLHYDAFVKGIFLQEEGFEDMNYDGNDGGDIDDVINITVSYFGLFFWGIIGMLTAILIIIIFIIQTATQMSLVFFGSFAPIMVMLLITPQTRPYFFSWLKNYISISLYLPLTLIPLLIMTHLGKVLGITGGHLYRNTSYYTFLFIIGIMIAAYILYKIPEWINIIMGTQEGHSNMAMAQSTIGGAFAISKLGLGKTASLAKGAIGGTIKGAGATAKFMKNPIHNTKTGASNVKNKIKELFGFKASSQHHDKN